VSALLVSTKMN